MFENNSRWTNEHVDKAYNILKKIKRQKSRHMQFLDQSVYWLLLLIAVVGNILISILVGLLIFVSGQFQLYLVVTALGAAFGALIERAVSDVEHPVKEHHLIFGAVVSFVALISFSIITGLINKLRITTEPHPLAVGAVYAVSFAIPFIYYGFVNKRQ